MPSEAKRILKKIKDGQAIKVSGAIEGLSESEYYIDSDGRVYSLNRETPSEVVRKPGKNGNLCVALMSSEGYTQYCVADLVANTMLQEELSALGGKKSDYIVAFKNQDRMDVRLENLTWINKLEAGESGDRGDSHEGTHSSIALAKAQSAVDRQDERELPVTECEQEDDDEIVKESVVEMVERLRVMKSKKDKQDIAYRRMSDAVDPFRRFVMSPEHRHGNALMTVLEANKGRPEHSILTVGDFVELQKIMGDLEDDPQR